MKTKIIGSIAVWTLLAGTPLWADKITDQLKAVEQAYGQKDYRGALDELEFAKAQILKLKNSEDQQLLPEALEGWSKSVKKQKSGVNPLAMLGGGGAGATTLSADYTKGNERVNVQIMANSPMLNMMNMIIGNPAMMANEEGTEPFRYKRNKGMKKVNGNSVEITLLIAGQIALIIKGDKLKDKAVVEQYLEKIDIAKLKDALL